MFQVIKDFCDSERKSGLLLLDAPTGSGKTYQVCKYIHEAVKRDKDASINRKYFFITTQKKNLPIEELRAIFTDAGDGKLFSEAVLRVDSNTDSVRGFLKRDAGDDAIPSEIRETKEWQNLTKSEQMLSSLEDLLKSPEDFKGAFDDAEGAFRRMAARQLQAAFKTVDERLEALKSDKNWQWLGKMYPAAFMKEKRVICMSVDKFFLPFATLVDETCTLYDSPSIEGSVVFIDEVDASKKVLLDRIIGDGLKTRVDELELFLTLHSSLQSHVFPIDLTRPSSKQKRSLEYVIDKNKRIAQGIFDEYSLCYNFKTRGARTGDKNFLFHDYSYFSVLQSKMKHVSVETSHEDQLNHIILSADKNEEQKDQSTNESYRLPRMLGEVRGFINHFIGGARLLAQNYKERKSEAEGANVVFTLDQAVETVLSEFTNGRDYTNGGDQKNWLKPRVLSGVHNKVQVHENQVVDLSFWESGFRYYAFEDSPLHDTSSTVMMTSFDTTPEKLLLALCKRAKVLGISATASVRSNVGNYDIEYLEQRLQDDFVRLTDEEDERIKKRFDEANNYEGVKVNVELVGADAASYKEESWQAVFDDEEAASAVFWYVERNIKDDSNHYKAIRYFKIAFVFRRFLEKDDIRSFLCMLNRSPKENDAELSRDVLSYIFDQVAKDQGIESDVCCNVAYLVGTEYDNNKGDILSRLVSGEKLFVISTYQTIGAGQNLQYTIPKDLEGKLVKTGRESDQKDFDAIYLDEPTNLLVNINDGLKEEDLVRWLFQVEALKERGELSQDDALKAITAAFKCWALQKRVFTPNVPDLYACPSVARYAAIRLIQAIGRICRTGNKQSNVWVFADRAIAGSVDPDVIKGGCYNHEVVKLFSALPPLSWQPEPTTEAENQASLSSCKAASYIKSYLGGQWSRRYIEQWQEIRRLTLMFPTMTCEEAKRNRFADLYVTLPSQDSPIYYTQQGDYTHVQVFFSKPAVRDVYQVCETAARLDKLMSYPDLRQWFKAQGFATTFGSGEVVMSPPLFNNIYKGALGEVCGKWFFDRLSDRLPDVELEEITDEAAFEVFDFKVVGKPVYVDFKNWGAATDFEEAAMLKKIQDKARGIGARGVVVANIFHAQGDTKLRFEDPLDGVRLLRVPALLAGEGEVRLVDDAVGAIKDFIGEFSKEESDECIE